MAEKTTKKPSKKALIKELLSKDIRPGDIPRVLREQQGIKVSSRYVYNVLQDHNGKAPTSKGSAKGKRRHSTLRFLVEAPPSKPAVAKNEAITPGVYRAALTLPSGPGDGMLVLRLLTPNDRLAGTLLISSEGLQYVRLKQKKIQLDRRISWTALESLMSIGFMVR